MKTKDKVIFKETYKKGVVIPDSKVKEWFKLPHSIELIDHGHMQSGTEFVTIKVLLK